MTHSRKGFLHAAEARQLSSDHTSKGTPPRRDTQLIPDGPAAYARRYRRIHQWFNAEGRRVRCPPRHQQQRTRSKRDSDAQTQTPVAAITIALRACADRARVEYIDRTARQDGGEYVRITARRDVGEHINMTARQVGGEHHQHDSSGR